MKVLNLRCANGHGFEGWFGSDADFVEQNGRGLIECPLCADKIISRLPSAPRLNLSGAREPRAVTPAPSERASRASSGAIAVTGASPSQTATSPAAHPDLQTLWLQTVRHVLATTEDVGERFAEEARRIHYGEVAARPIRGEATRTESAALREEGIEVMPLAIPKLLKEPLQ